MEPNCVSYNFNKKEKANGGHKCDLNNATYEHDSKHPGDLAKNKNYVYRGAEVNIQSLSTLGTLEKFENKAIFLWLGPPSTLMRHQKGSFRKRSEELQNAGFACYRYSTIWKRSIAETMTSRYSRDFSDRGDCGMAFSNFSGRSVFGKHLMRFQSKNSILISNSTFKQPFMKDIIGSEVISHASLPRRRS